MTDGIDRAESLLRFPGFHLLSTTITFLPHTAHMAKPTKHEKKNASHPQFSARPVMNPPQSARYPSTNHAKQSSRLKNDMDDGSQNHRETAAVEGRRGDRPIDQITTWLEIQLQRFVAVSLQLKELLCCLMVLGLAMWTFQGLLC